MYVSFRLSISVSAFLRIKRVHYSFSPLLVCLKRWQSTSMFCNQQNQRNLFYRSAPATFTWNSSKYSYSKNPHCKVFVRRETRERYQQESSVVRPSCRHTERTKTGFRCSEIQLDYIDSLTITLSRICTSFLTCTVFIVTAIIAIIGNTSLYTAITVSHTSVF